MDLNKYLAKATSDMGLTKNQKEIVSSLSPDDWIEFNSNYSQVYGDEFYGYDIFGEVIQLA